MTLKSHQKIGLYKEWFILKSELVKYFFFFNLNELNLLLFSPAFFL